MELNAQDAALWSILEGDTVKVESRDSDLMGIARLNATLPEGLVAITGLFGQLVVDLESSEEPDPMACVPGLDLIPVKVAKATEA